MKTCCPSEWILKRISNLHFIKTSRVATILVVVAFWEIVELLPRCINVQIDGTFMFSKACWMGNKKKHPLQCILTHFGVPLFKGACCSRLNLRKSFLAVRCAYCYCGHLPISTSSVPSLSHLSCISTILEASVFTQFCLLLFSFGSCAVFL